MFVPKFSNPSVVDASGGLCDCEKLCPRKIVTFWCVVISDVLELQYENNCKIITVPFFSRRSLQPPTTRTRGEKPPENLVGPRTALRS